MLRCVIEISFSLKQTVDGLRVTWMHRGLLPANFKTILGLHCCVHLRKLILMNVRNELVRNVKFKISIVRTSCIACTLRNKRKWHRPETTDSHFKTQCQLWSIAIFPCLRTARTAEDTMFTKMYGVQLLVINWSNC